MDRNKFNLVNFLVMRINWWVAAWIDMVCGLLGVVTFTIYRPWWDMDYRFWITRLMTMKKKSNL